MAAALDGADVTERTLGPEDAALVPDGAGAAAAARDGRVAGIYGGTVAVREMGEGRPTVVGQSTEHRIGAGDVVGQWREGAAAEVLDQVMIVTDQRA